MDFFNVFRKKRERVYLDYAAATPVAPEVLREMAPYWNESFANPSSIHAEGVAARKVVETARHTVADLLKIRRSDVVFTSGGTESNNLAIVGIVESLHAQGRAYTEMEIVSTRMEHPSVLETVKFLEVRGVRVVYLTPNKEGLILETELLNALSPKTVLVVLSYVNSEIGVVQDVKRLVRAVRASTREGRTHVYVHLDASQAPLWLSCEMDMLGVDTMTLDAGKCYGPKGVGVLAFRHGVLLQAVMGGGGQESGLRPGTENVPLIVGCSYALKRAQSSWRKRSEKVMKLRDIFLTALLTEIKGAVLNGSQTERVANNVNISIPSVDAEFAVITLDAEGIAASTKSACAGGDGGGSVVVMEISGDAARAHSTLRFTLGEGTTEKELERTVAVLKAHVMREGEFKKRHHTGV